MRHRTRCSRREWPSALRFGRSDAARPHERPRGQQGRDARPRAHRGRLLHRERPDRRLAPAGEQDRPAPRGGRLPLGARRAQRVEQRLAVHGRLRPRRPCLRRVRAPPARIPVGRAADEARTCPRRLRICADVLRQRGVLLVDETPSTACETCRSTIALTDSKTASDAFSLAGSVLGLVILGAILFIVVRRFRAGVARPAPRPRARARRGRARRGAPAARARRRQHRQRLRDTARVPLPRELRDGADRVSRRRPAQPARPRAARGCPAGARTRQAAARGARRGASRPDARDRVLAAGAEPVRLGGGQGDPRRRHPGGALRRARRQRIAALLHDPSLAYDPELVEAVAAAAGLWIENERLHADLRAQVRFLDTVVNTSPSLLCALDLDGRIVNFNIACGSAGGRDDPESIRQELFWDVFSGPAEREAMRARFEAGRPTTCRSSSRARSSTRAGRSSRSPG